MTTKRTTPAVLYKTESSGGYWRVRRYENGKQMGSAGSFGSRTVADRLTDELNFAFRAGWTAALKEVGEYADTDFEGENPLRAVVQELSAR